MNEKKVTETKLVLDDVPFRVSYDPDKKSGSLHFSFADTTITMTDKDKKIGSLAGCLGCGIEFRMEDDIDPKTYYIDGFELWNAFCRSLGYTKYLYKPKK